MGLMDIASKVLISVKADTSDAKAKIKELSGEQKKAAKEQIEAIEAGNKKLDSQVAMLGKVGIALGAVTAAVLVGKAGFEHYMRSSQLAANTAGTDFDRLAKAADGLKSKTELLNFANTAMRGTWKLNQSQMEVVLKGMRALELQGFNSIAVQEKFAMAFSKGNAEELKEYGINVKTMSGLLYELDERSRKATGSSTAQGDEIRRAGVEFANAKDTIVHSIGQIVVAMAPLVAEVAKLATEVAAVIGPIAGWVADRIGDARTLARNANSDTWNREEMLARHGGGGPTWGAVIGGLVQDTHARTEVAAQLAAFGRMRGQVGTDALNRGTFAMNQATRALPMKRRPGASVGLDNQFGTNVFDDRLLFGTPQSVGADLSTAGSLVGGVDIARLLGNPDSAASRYGAFSKGRSQSKLAEMFGPIEEFKAYAAGFDLLSTAATSAFNAWISGSESLGSAIKKGIAEGLIGTAGQMLSQSLLHAAYAVGSAAFYDYAGAAKHGKAAAMFAAGAIATGGLAKALGGGGAGVGAAGAAAPNVTGSAGAASSSPRQTIVVLGDSYDGMTPRQRQQLASKQITAAMREADGTSAVRFS